ncbi:DUF2848 domain-containing protein [Halomonas sp. MCCC 1A17488]|uniref:DUF2848 domain-containing protein n=1 Tax=unclassified Halomonas TaxID=2609666 RepID=UPI0018D1FDCC|nr:MULTISPECIES: DUF2848 domain-containing protein [unclassified Halomonas]MCE8014998.1 DUF2848 domain-containing protein [Halomonas sp. MCCC 1A17488]MCG3238331.1 DUF2848 domain-containing protein [Halomonas sp. MCCC 1A17488]QPP47918.1 DUF2848 domain-containing protein [Halomonas sp. SS10-MC5]
MLIFHVSETDKALKVDIQELIIAGWAGREQSAIDEHIEELEAIGVKPPSATPLFYRVAANQLTTEPTIQVLGEASSGEVEVVLIGTQQGTLVGIGSDHTDREAEAWSVAHSKQVCAKPVSRCVWRLESVLDHWDDLQMVSYATIEGQEVVYQQGGVTGLLHPAELLRRFGLDEVRLAPGQAMLCGTLPVKGEVRAAEAFRVVLTDPVSGRELEHQYRIKTLPVVA